MLKSINIPKSIETSLGNIDTRGLPLANTISNSLSTPLTGIKNIAENAEYYGGVDLSSLNKIIDKNNAKIDKTVGKIQLYSDAVNLITGGFGTKIPNYNDLLDAADLLEVDVGNRDTHLENIKSIVNVINGDMKALLDFDKPHINNNEVAVTEKDFNSFKNSVDLQNVDFSDLDEALGCSKEKMKTFRDVISPSSGSSSTLNKIKNKYESACNDLDEGSTIMLKAFPQLKDTLNPFKSTVDTAIGEYSAQLTGVATNVTNSLNNITNKITNTVSNLNNSIVGNVENQIRYYKEVIENESGISMEPLNIFFKNYIDRKNPLPQKIGKIQNDINGYREIMTDKISKANSTLQSNISTLAGIRSTEQNATSGDYSEIVSSDNSNISNDSDCLDKQVEKESTVREKNNPYERLLTKNPIITNVISNDTSNLKDSLKLTIGKIPAVQDTLKLIDYHLENNIISKSLLLSSDMSDEMTKLAVNAIQTASGTTLDPSFVANIKILADKNINKINKQVNENYSILNKIEKQKSILKSLII